jgi:hypothetical protein
VPLAPIALFVFRRPDHARRTIESLLANPEAASSEIVVFCDGPRGERDVEPVRITREAVRAAGIPNLRLVERDQNLGLARSIIAGVSELCASHGSVIALEDDLILSPTFLAFMNEALDRYRDDPRVFAISGYTIPIEPPPDTDAFFLPFSSSIGWATWSRAWSVLATSEEAHAVLGRDRAARRRFDLDGAYPYWAMLQDQLSGKVDSWAIRWYATIFLRAGLVLFPSVSLVENIGFDGTGVHSGSGTPGIYSARAAPLRVRAFPRSTSVHDEAFRRMKRLLRQETWLPWRTLRTLTSGTRRILRAIRKVVRG